MNEILTGYAYAPPPVPIKPDREEKRAIRKRYTKIGLVILANIVLINVVLYGVVWLCCGIYAGELSRAGISEGLDAVSENDFLQVLVSVGIPIISEIAVIILGFKLFGFKLKALTPPRKYKTKTVVKLIVLVFGLSLAAAILTLITELFYMGKTPQTADILGLKNSLAANILLYFYACLLGPVLEEILYRGFLLNALKKYNHRMAVFVSALIFGLMHQNYQQFYLGFLIGIPLAVVTLKYGSLIPAIIAHIAINTTNVFFLLLIEHTTGGLNEFITSMNDIAFSMDFSDVNPAAVAIFIINMVLRFGLAIAALVIGIVSLVKGGNMSRPTPAGKSRGVPLIATSWAWILIFAVYIYYCFVQPLV